tara:strand:- start:270 stop:950 length:681 start_codon:yes stop_codon:yes gene_type:complete
LRQLIIDTETSGLDFDKDRIIEVGCLELIEGIFTGNKFHQYYKPDEIEISSESEKIHGLSNKFLAEFPTFEDEIEEFMAFVGDSQLIMHNAQFDITMINNALKRSGINKINPDSTICTLEIAKKKFPGSKNNLNALCRRFGISLENREKHGALTDSFLLLQVYNELLGGKQQTLSLKLQSKEKQLRRLFNKENNEFVCAKISSEEEKSHEEMLKSLHKNIWQNFDK